MSWLIEATLRDGSFQMFEQPTAQPMALPVIQEACCLRASPWPLVPRIPPKPPNYPPLLLYTKKEAY